MDAVILPPVEATQRRFPWWIPLIAGILVSAVGLGLLAWPFTAASWLLATLFGAALIAGGLAALVRQRPGAVSVVGGIVLVAGGILAIAFQEFTAGALVTFVAVTLILVGAFWLILALRLGGGSALVALPAVLLIGAGVVALIWPSVALVLAAIVAGLCALMAGAAIIWGAIRLRRVDVTTATFRL